MQATTEEAQALLESNPPAIDASFRHLSDLFLLAEDGYLPVRGFLPGREVIHVAETMHLTTGEPWSIPVILPIAEDLAEQLRRSERVVLKDSDGTAAGVLHIEEIFKIDKPHYARHIFRTEDPAHPGSDRWRRAATR